MNSTGDHCNACNWISTLTAWAGIKTGRKTSQDGTSVSHPYGLTTTQKSEVTPKARGVHYRCCGPRPVHCPRPAVRRSGRKPRPHALTARRHQSAQPTDQWLCQLKRDPRGQSERDPPLGGLHFDRSIAHDQRGVAKRRYFATVVTRHYDGHPHG